VLAHGLRRVQSLLESLRDAQRVHHGCSAVVGISMAPDSFGAIFVTYRL